MSDAFDLRKEEYLALRKEIESCLKELSDLERNCVIASATAYAWVATNATLGTPLVASAWLIPAILPVYGAARSKTIGEQLGAIGAYIKRIEIKLLPKAPTDEEQDGWEHFFERHGKTTATKMRTQFWWSLWILSVVCSILGYCLTLAHPIESTLVASPASAPSSPPKAVKAP